jgi:alkylation response protein AidB-like acyl-CoA dehydrogenase
VSGVVERADSPVLVEHLDDLDHLVVLDHRRVAVLTDVRSRGLTTSGPARPLDPLTPVWWIGDLAPGEPIGGAEERERWAQEGALLTAALAAGVATAATELACAYALQREQFDRTVASFQAVKHLLADMAVRAEMARTGVEAAAASYDQLDAPEAATAIASASVVARDAACRNGRDGVLVHGGMGYTWEVDAHLFMKRAQILAQQFGSPAMFALQLGQRM